MEGNGSVHGALGAAVCVLWHAHGRAPSAALSGALARKGVEVVRVEGPYAALAEVCRRQQDTRRPVILLVDATEPQPSRAEVVQLARVHAPRALCWVYQPGAADRLRAVTDADVRAWEASEAKPADRAGPPTPKVVVRSVHPNPGPAAIRMTEREREVGGSIAQAGEHGKPAPRATGRAAPALRLTEAPKVHPPAANADAQAGGTPDAGVQTGGARRNGAQLLTQEELAMLLAEDEPS